MWLLRRLSSVLVYRATKRVPLLVLGLLTLLLLLFLLNLSNPTNRLFAANLSFDWYTNTNSYTQAQRDDFVALLPDEIRTRILSGHAYAIRHEHNSVAPYCTAIVADNPEATLTLNFTSNIQMNAQASQGAIWRVSNNVGSGGDCPAVSPSVGSFTGTWTAVTYAQNGNGSFQHCAGAACQNRGMFLGGVDDITYAASPTLASGFPRPDAIDVLQYLYPVPPPDSGESITEQQLYSIAARFGGVFLAGFLSVLIVRQFRWRGTS